MSTLPSSGGAAACPQSLSATASRRDDRHPLRRLARTTGAVALAAIVLSACAGLSDHGDSHGSTPATPAATAALGSTSATSADPADSHNDADIAFAQGMIVHHQGALEMSALAADRAGSDAVRQLADRIAAAQTPEIELMTGWLRTWSAPAPSDAAMSASASMDHDMSGHDMSADPSMDQAMGLMSAQDMAGLASASGADFDRRFLELMIVHHQGAVTMSQTELEDGESAAALALARTIIDSQTAEIAEMRGLLTTT